MPGSLNFKANGGRTGLPRSPLRGASIRCSYGAMVRDCPSETATATAPSLVRTGGLLCAEFPMSLPPVQATALTAGGGLAPLRPPPPYLEWYGSEGNSAAATWRHNVDSFTETVQYTHAMPRASTHLVWPHKETNERMRRMWHHLAIASVICLPTLSGLALAQQGCAPDPVEVNSLEGVVL